MRKLSLFLISLGFVYFLQFGSENEYGNEFALPYGASAEEASGVQARDHAVPPYPVEGLPSRL